MPEGNSIPIADGDELRETVNAASDSDITPGDELVIADGVHEDCEVEIDVQGTEDAPITIRAESEHGAVFTGESHLRVTGHHVVVRDLRFEHSTSVPEYGAVALWNSDRCRVANCEFEDLYGMLGTVAIQHGASDNRIDHNHFANCRYRAVRVGVHEETLESGPPVRNRVDHNVIRDIPDASDEPEAGAAEAIQIGQWGRPWSTYETHVTIENNFFLRCNGENEIISVKTTNNVIRDNAFVDCVTGELVLRGGDRTTVEGNWFENTNHGIRVLGWGHRIVNNTIVEPSGMGIRVPHGTDDVDFPTGYKRVHSTVVANNTIVRPGDTGIMVGGYPHTGQRTQTFPRATEPPFDHHTDSVERDVPPTNSVFVNNVVVGRESTLFEINEAPDNIYSHNLLHATGAAEAGDVGDRPILEKPQFCWPGNGDYRLCEQSPSGRGYGEGYPLLPSDEDGLYHVGANRLRSEAGPSGDVFADAIEIPPVHELDGLPESP